MNSNLITQERYQGIPIIAFTVIQGGPNDFPEDIPDRPEEELPENDPNDQPEIDQEDLDTEEELDLGEQEEVPELDEEEIDESANDAEGVPVEPRNPPSDLNETTI
ncbi:hypothetical protein BWD42_03490 [Sphingobacterium sp. CZ-UAM]|uniref:hypothetical protein n=1 Tax=Sphingobacterium sp. CZ-UAM TaxID=1933868 RepID=UPI0009842C43|nr:hypothetical protein [Sphingobacterium sp. CZ-UAM]OOG19028.1 hypothetical protein BWD42_03490 [Sphingobacterium sp. CZ-UAM]